MNKQTNNTLPLDTIQTEALRLKFWIQLETKEFKDTLTQWCYNFNVDINEKDKIVVLIDEDTDAELHIPNTVKDIFFNLLNDKEHWLKTKFKFTSKEILLLLYKYPELHELL